LRRAAVFGGISLIIVKKSVKNFHLFAKYKNPFQLCTALQQLTPAA